MAKVSLLPKNVPTLLVACVFVYSDAHTPWWDGLPFAFLSHYSTSQDQNPSENFYYYQNNWLTGTDTSRRKSQILHQHLVGNHIATHTLTFPRIIHQSDAFLASRAATLDKNAITGANYGHMRPSEERLVKNKLAINKAKGPSDIVNNLETLAGHLSSCCDQS